MSDETMVEVLIEHQRQNAGSCLCGWSKLGYSHPEHQAAAIFAAGYRKPCTITTAEEMDKLGFQAVVLDVYGTPYVCERHRTDGTRNEWKPSGMNHLDDSEAILYHGPVTVVHDPEDTK